MFNRLICFFRGHKLTLIKKQAEYLWENPPGQFPSSVNTYFTYKCKRCFFFLQKKLIGDITDTLEEESKNE